jgi:hypothetical protein
VGFLGVAGVAIIALYVYAQGRRGRKKGQAQTEVRTESDNAASQQADPTIAEQVTGTDGE